MYSFIKYGYLSQCCFQRIEHISNTGSNLQHDFKNMQDLKLEKNYYNFRHSEQSNYIDHIEFRNEMKELNFLDVTIIYITLTVINTATSKSFGKHH